MGLDNDIEYAMKGILKNPILSILREIKTTNILKQSNFKKRETGYPVFFVLLHFVYMLLMNKRQSSFIKQSNDAYGKDTYYRFIQSKRYNCTIEPARPRKPQDKGMVEQGVQAIQRWILAVLRDRTFFSVDEPGPYHSKS